MRRAWIVLFAMACGAPSASPAEPPSPSAEPRPPAPAGDVIEGCYVEAGGPDPFACATDADCTTGGLFDADACCMTGVTHAHARAYHEWQLAAFRARCDGTCVTPPAAPSDCEIAVRCDGGRCANGCGAQAAPSDAELDVMDPGDIELWCQRGSTAACDRLGH
jgi:hypothetical protein